MVQKVGSIPFRRGLVNCKEVIRMGETIKRKHRCPECDKEFNIEITVDSTVCSDVKLLFTKIRHYTKLMDTRDYWPHA